MGARRPMGDAAEGRSPEFECHICLDAASEPVLTPCGHLFCWPCIYTWLQRSHRPSGYDGGCPVCKADVSVQKLTPIYGRGRPQIDPRSPIPDRPTAQRPDRSRASPGSGGRRTLGDGTDALALSAIFGVEGGQQRMQPRDLPLTEGQRMLLAAGTLLILLCLLLL
jgi:hypothetical protein